ncbi:ESX secretion-associated protein EspG [Actinokineospora sp. HUAS TT18]|uniref:ESX secretion-associated protein EspG n=1 Tax=Actinokineospora sp. HUAS TT18 TaxID=3447451 RepID=UPI003F521406
MKVELSVHTLYRLLETQNLGEPHTVFTGGERYYSPRFKQEDDARFRRALEEAKIVTPRGVDPDFLDLLQVIQRAGSEYYGWLHDAEGPYTVLTAVSGRMGVLAERIGDQVTFERIDPARALESFVYRLPNVPPARGEAISVRVSDLGPGKVDSYGRRAPVPPQARRLDELMKQPRVGGGKLYTARRDQRGKRLRAAEWITAIDLQAGRWAIYQTGRGEKSVMAVPGSAQFIGKRLRELHETIG